MFDLVCSRSRAFLSNCRLILRIMQLLTSLTLTNQKNILEILIKNYMIRNILSLESDWRKICK